MFKKLINVYKLRYFSKLIIILAIGLFPGSLYSGDNSKFIDAKKTENPPVIDGYLTELDWDAAVPSSGFIQRDPNEGEQASEATEIRVMYDDEALYFGCMMFDSEPDKIVARLTRRDNEINSDVISIRIDSYHDHQTAFEFTINAAGVKVDILQYDDAQREDISWDAVWEAQAKILPNGWSAEIKIPFSILRYRKNGNSEYDWGINFIRLISRKNERSFWSPIKKSESGFISRFGHLKGLQNLPEQMRLEALPFATVKQSFEPSTEDFPKKPDFSKNAGVDVKYGLTSNFTLEATINPDFGQVEADPAVLNLTTYETFFPEKRPFFIEGTQILRFSTFGNQFGPGLFYSRRIGRAISKREIKVPSDGYIKHLPQNVTILGAAKLSGKTSDGLSVGLLQAVTKQEYVTVVDSTGISSKQMIEPLAHFNIVRLKQDIFENSNIGLIITSVAKQQRSPIFTSGLDWNIRLLDNNYSVDGFFAGSNGNNRGKRIDGSAGRFNFGKIAGDHWLWNTAIDFTSNNYNINDLGFFQRPKDYGFISSIIYKEDQPSELLREWRTSLFLHERRSFDGPNLFREARIGGYGGFHNYWRLRSFASVEMGKYDDRETRGNGLYLKPVSSMVGFFLRTDNRKNYIIGYDYDFGFDSKMKRVHVHEVELELMPLTWIEIGLGSEYKQIRNQEAWAKNVWIGDKLVSIFGDRSTDEVNFTLRTTFTFTHELTLQLYGQLFVAKGYYKNFRQLVDTKNFVNYTETIDRDFNEQFFNTNLVIRWEYIPGSTAYLVWTHNREREIENYFTNLKYDMNETFRTTPANIFLLKVSYWLSL